MRGWPRICPEPERWGRPSNGGRRTSGRVQGYAGEHCMTHLVEISLRIPSIRAIRDGKDSPTTIANSDMRFIKQVELEIIPKAGDILTMTVESADAFQCE